MTENKQPQLVLPVGTRIVTRLPYLPDLFARKVTGAEQSNLAGSDFSFHEAEYARPVPVLEESSEQSQLLEAPTAGPALHDLLVRIRLGGIHTAEGAFRRGSGRGELPSSSF